MSLVFLDTETTGLDPVRHQVFEVAWAVDDGPLKRVVLKHDLGEGADPRALRVNKYLDRRIDECPFGLYNYGDEPAAHLMENMGDHEAALRAIRQDWSDAHLVCSNPAFDESFLVPYLRKYGITWDAPFWHHRKVALESYAMAKFGWTQPKGMKAVRDELVDHHQLPIPEPDHTAVGDVIVLRQCFHALEAL